MAEITDAEIEAALKAAREASLVASTLEHALRLAIPAALTAAAAVRAPEWTDEQIERAFKAYQTAATGDDKEAFRIALATLRAPVEPVAWMVSFEGKVAFSVTEPVSSPSYMTITPLYASPPPPSARVEPVGWRDIIAEFERRTEAVPLGHEINERGASTYNWRKQHAKELREIAASPPPPSPSSEVTT